MLKIHTEKIVKNGKKKRKILDWEGLMDSEDFPKGYLHTNYFFIRMFCQSGICINIPTKKGSIPMFLEKNHIYSEEYFQKAIKAAKKAGRRLHIMRKNEKLKKTWYGKETIII